MKKKPKKQSDAAFIKKIGTLSIGGKTANSSLSFAQMVEKHGPPDAMTVVASYRRMKPRHDDSGEESLSA